MCPDCVVWPRGKPRLQYGFPRETDATFLRTPPEGSQDKHVQDKSTRHANMVIPLKRTRVVRLTSPRRGSYNTPNE